MIVDHTQKNVLNTPCNMNPLGPRPLWISLADPPLPGDGECTRHTLIEQELVTTHPNFHKGSLEKHTWVSTDVHLQSSAVVELLSIACSLNFISMDLTCFLTAVLYLHMSSIILQLLMW